MLVTLPAWAYDLKNLSSSDVLVIGRGLDRLPRADTDANGLYKRLNDQINEQNAAAAKAAEDAMRAKIGAEKRPSENIVK